MVVILVTGACPTSAQPADVIASPEGISPVRAFEGLLIENSCGQIAFGHDGYLYIPAGDGGTGGDPQGDGQNGATLLGAILRIDVGDASGTYAIPADMFFVVTGFPHSPALYGKYVYADYVTGCIWTLSAEDPDSSAADSSDPELLFDTDTLS